MNIIVGVDGSGPSRAAVTWALKRARSTGGGVSLVHVVDDEWGQLGQEYAERDEIAAAALLADALRSAATTAPGIEVSGELRHGSPAWELCATAQPGDMIVVGTHKTGYLHGRALGTMSIVVASIAPCRVTVVPEGSTGNRMGVVAGVTGRSWHDAVVVAALEAAQLGQDLSLIHASPVREEIEDGSSNSGRALLAAAAALAMETVPSSVVRSRLSRRHPADALLDASRSASLLVLGSSRRNPAHAGFIGSVAHDVLLNINSTVMIARLPDEPADVGG